MRTKREIVDDVNQLRSDYVAAKRDGADPKGDVMKDLRQRHADLSKEHDDFLQAEHDKKRAAEHEETEAKIEELAKRANEEPEKQTRAAPRPGGKGDPIVTESLRTVTDGGNLSVDIDRQLREKYGVTISFGGGDPIDPDKMELNAESELAMLSMMGAATPEPEVFQYLRQRSIDRGLVEGRKVHRPFLQERAAGDPLRTDGTDAQGGYFIPNDNRFYRQLIMEERAYMGPVGRYTWMIRTPHGRPIPITTLDDTETVFNSPAQAGDTAQHAVEGTAMVAPKEILFGRQTLDAHLQSTGQVPVSEQFLVDIEATAAFIFQVIAERLARRVHQQYASGDGGSDQPLGYLASAITAEDMSGPLPDWSVANATWPITDAATARQVAALPRRIAHVLDIAYRRKPNTVVMLNDQVMLALATATDNDGKLQFPALAWMDYEKPTMVGGIKTMVDPNIPNQAQGNNVVFAVLADWNSYVTREVSGYRMKRNPFSNEDQNEILFTLQKRIDAVLIRSRAMRRLTNTVAA